MATDIIGIRIFKGESTTDIMAKDCKYMHLGQLDIQIQKTERAETEYIPGINYMLDAAKFPIPIMETDIFVPMTSVVQISFDLPF
jgi:hypothetical protein